jgi:hypothetical protein
MSIKTKIAALAIAALALTGSITSSTRSAEAHGFGMGHGFGHGFGHGHGFGRGGWGFGADLVGAAITGSDDGYYDAYPRCTWVRQFDAYGNYMGRVRACN